MKQVIVIDDEVLDQVIRNVDFWYEAEMKAGGDIDKRVRACLAATAIAVNVPAMRADDPEFARLRDDLKCGTSGITAREERDIIAKFYNFEKEEDKTVYDAVDKFDVITALGTKTRTAPAEEIKEEIDREFRGLLPMTMTLTFPEPE